MNWDKKGLIGAGYTSSGHAEQSLLVTMTSAISASAARTDWPNRVRAASTRWMVNFILLDLGAMAGGD